MESQITIDEENIFSEKSSHKYLHKKQKNKKHLTAHTDSIILLPLMRGRYMNGYQRPEAGMQ